MIQKVGNRYGKVFGGYASTNHVVSSRYEGNMYKGWLDIEAWMMRNLFSFNNCSIKKKLFDKVEWQFKNVFGEGNYKIEDAIDPAYVTVNVSDEGLEHARVFLNE